MHGKLARSSQQECIPIRPVIRTARFTPVECETQYIGAAIGLIRQRAYQVRPPGLVEMLHLDIDIFSQDIESRRESLLIRCGRAVRNNESYTAPVHGRIRMIGSKRCEHASHTIAGRDADRRYPVALSGKRCAVRPITRHLFPDGSFRGQHAVVDPPAPRSGIRCARDPAGIVPAYPTLMRGNAPKPVRPE